MNAHFTKFCKLGPRFGVAYRGHCVQLSLCEQSRRSPNDPFPEHSRSIYRYITFSYKISNKHVKGFHGSETSEDKSLPCLERIK